MILKRCGLYNGYEDCLICSKKTHNLIDFENYFSNNLNRIIFFDNLFTYHFDIFIDHDIAGTNELYYSTSLEVFILEFQFGLSMVQFLENLSIEPYIIHKIFKTELSDELNFQYILDLDTQSSNLVSKLVYQRFFEKELSPTKPFISKYGILGKVVLDLSKEGFDTDFNIQKGYMINKIDKSNEGLIKQVYRFRFKSLNFELTDVNSCISLKVVSDDYVMLQNKMLNIPDKYIEFKPISDQVADYKNFNIIDIVTDLYTFVYGNSLQHIFSKNVVYSSNNVLNYFKK